MSELEEVRAAWHAAIELGNKRHAEAARLRAELCEIAATDPIDAALDPQRLVMIARVALRGDAPARVSASGTFGALKPDRPKCALCEGKGSAFLNDPWGGVHGTCPDCHGTGNSPERCAAAGCWSPDCECVESANP